MEERDFSVNQRLRDLMKWHHLKRAEVCRVLGLKVHMRSYSNGTLDNWLALRHPMKERDLVSVSQYVQALSIVERVDRDRQSIPV